MSAKKLVPAVAYLRKSTKGKKADGTERQEKSIGQQRSESEKLAHNRYHILRWYIDEGVSGWKRDGKRPEFDKMLRDARDRQFQVVICDDLDRFSRAEVMEVFNDLSTLAAGGVKTIHCVNQGEYSLGDNDIGRLIKMVVDIHGGNEFSKRLSRRVALAQRNNASNGRRAGSAPYGMESDGNGGLKHGDRKKIKIVRRVFDEFVERKRSLNGIAGGLNADKIPSPRGGERWSVMTIKELLRRPAYRGDFTYGRRQEGRFHTIADNREVVESKDRTHKQWAYRDPVIRIEGKYTPIVDPKQWDAAQARLKTFALTGTARESSKYGYYPLAGILICDHCGKPLHACTPHKDKPNRRVYRCSSFANFGQTVCRPYWVNESKILPCVLRILGEEIGDARKLLAGGLPKELRFPQQERSDEREQIKRDLALVRKKIENGKDYVLNCPDARIRRSFDATLAAMLDEERRLLAKLDNGPGPTNGYAKDDLRALADWWDDFDKRAVSVPLKGNRLTLVEWLGRQDAFSDEPALLVDPRIVNDALQTLGAEVRLRWSTKRVTLRNGQEENRYSFTGGRLRLGQQNGYVKRQNGAVTFRKAAEA